MKAKDEKKIRKYKSYAFWVEMAKQVKGPKQLRHVYRMLDDAHFFGYQTSANYAYDAMEQFIKDNPRFNLLTKMETI